MNLGKLSDERNLTKEEEEVLDVLGKAATMFFGLEKIHPSDIQDFVYAIHLAQNLVMARPGMRQYQQKNGINYMARKV